MKTFSKWFCLRMVNLLLNKEFVSLSVWKQGRALKIDLWTMLANAPDGERF